MAQFLYGIQVCFSAPVIRDSSTPLTPQQIAKKALDATVLIVMEDENGLTLSTGSGFFISRDIIATNLHVVKTGH